MNYLAHAFLSLNNPEIQIGNLIGDFVKGNKFLLYPEKIKEGILLHRKIDFYTDKHPIVHQAIAYFKPSFRLSGGIFVDILFDHFLANDIQHFTDEYLKIFTQNVYQNLKNNEIYFDDNMQQFFSYMTNYNWLYHYKHQEGLSKAILGICKRHTILGNGQTALTLIETNYEMLRKLYSDFFPELMKFANE